MLVQKNTLSTCKCRLNNCAKSQMIYSAVCLVDFSFALSCAFIFKNVLFCQLFFIFLKYVLNLQNTLIICKVFLNLTP